MLVNKIKKGFAIILLDLSNLSYPLLTSFDCTALMMFRTVTVAFGNLVENEDVVNSITTKDHGIFRSQLPSLVRSRKACSFLPHCV